MRYLNEKAVENIAVGAAFLGTGGGGDPYIGKMMALSAIKQHGSVQLISSEEVTDDDFFIPSAMMGAPSVLIEKFPKGDEFLRVFQKLSSYLNIEKISGTFPMEAGGVNSMIPIVVAASLGIPIVDCDGMGRAFPELQMTTFNLGGVSSTPMAITDEKGNIGISETINNKWTERLARVQTVEMGASSLISIYPSNGRQLKDHGIHGIVTLSEKIGEVICSNESEETIKLKNLLDLINGVELFQGKIMDVIRNVKNGFNLGEAMLEGLHENTGSSMKISFQNENLIAEKNGEVVAMTPDLICMVDLETLMPVTTETLKYGKRIRVIALPCHEKWQSAKGIELVGPRYFGYDLDYIPLKELVARGGSQYV
ncbi:DUF917 domain-containing protein [Enterococcus alishanensis]